MWPFSKPAKPLPICVQCRVAYEAPQWNTPHADHCQTCRKPLVDLYYRKKAVVDFVASDWQTYEKRVLADKKKSDAKWAKSALNQNKYVNAFSNAQGAQGGTVYTTGAGVYRFGGLV
jgi:hypothetical protein